MMNEKQICAGNIGDITFMCRPAMLTMLPMMKRGNEAIGSKVNFPLENCLPKGSTSLAIVTPSYRFAPQVFRKGLLFFKKSPYNLLAVYDLYSCLLHHSTYVVISFRSV